MGHARGEQTLDQSFHRLQLSCSNYSIIAANAGGRWLITYFYVGLRGGLLFGEVVWGIGGDCVKDFYFGGCFPG